MKLIEIILKRLIEYYAQTRTKEEKIFYNLIKKAYDS